MSCKHVVAIVLLAIAACAQTGSIDAPVSVRHFVAPAYPVTAWLARIQGTAVAEARLRLMGQWVGAENERQEEPERPRQYREPASCVATDGRTPNTPHWDHFRRHG
jgi:hypothetical protein